MNCAIVEAAGSVPRFRLRWEHHCSTQTDITKSPCYSSLARSLLPRNGGPKYLWLHTFMIRVVGNDGFEQSGDSHRQVQDTLYVRRNENRQLE